MARVRAYIFSCLAGEKNNMLLDATDLLMGCTRFAIDNPVPSVVTRCGWYGNTRDVTMILSDSEKKYGKANIKIDSK